MNAYFILTIVTLYSHQKAFQTASDENGDSSQKVITESCVDFANFGKEKEHLELKILVFETWIGFDLPVHTISLQEVDVLRAQVIDAQEEIEALKNPFKFISLRENSNTETSGTIEWPVLVHNSCETVFVLDASNGIITVKEPGVYQIHVRIGVANNNGNVYPIFLCRNKLSIVPALFGDKNFVQITEILDLNANDILSVQSHQLYSQNIQNCVFSVLKFV